MKVDEIYTSVQGEGQHFGKPTQFLRFGGCNMKCPGWPCDTQHAIDNKFYREWVEMGVDDVKEKIEPWPKHICVTGGEPMMQPQEELRQLFAELRANGYSIEMFTNGSFELQPWLYSYVDIMMDWKLEGSGEADTKLIQRAANLRCLKYTDGVKFVCADHEDLAHAYEWSYGLDFERFRGEIWVGTAWDALPLSEVVEFIRVNELPWRLNVQVHKYIWPGVERGI